MFFLLLKVSVNVTCGCWWIIWCLYNLITENRVTLRRVDSIPSSSNAEQIMYLPLIVHDLWKCSKEDLHAGRWPQWEAVLEILFWIHKRVRQSGLGRRSCVVFSLWYFGGWEIMRCISVIPKLYCTMFCLQEIMDHPWFQNFPGTPWRNNGHCNGVNGKSCSH